MNILDKVIAFVNPQAAVKRAATRNTLSVLDSGYGNYGGSYSRTSLKGWNAAGGSADEDIHEHLETLRERSRDLYAGVPLATAAFKKMRTSAVGTGLKLKSQIDFRFLKMDEEQARELEAQIEREFALFAESPNCDAERLDDFYELQQLAFLNWLMSGDVLVLLPLRKRVGTPYELTLRLIEADRISTPTDKAYGPNIEAGVEKDDFGEVVAYWVTNNHPLAVANRSGELTKWTRVQAYGEKTGRRNALFICSRERIGQKRGVPFIAPVIESLKQLGRYTDAELMAAVISGMFTVFIEKDGVSEESPLGEMEPVDTGDRTAVGAVRLGNGAIIDLQEGEKANAINPGRPNANFEGFVKAVSLQIGAALEIPYEVLVAKFSNNYSASRAELLEWYNAYMVYRGWISNDLCQPVFEEFMCEAVAKGRIKAPGFFTDPLIRKAYCGAKWNGPSQGQIDPLKEVNAAVVRVRNGFSTRDTEAMELNGSSFYTNVGQLSTENRMLAEAAASGSDKPDNSGSPENPDDSGGDMDGNEDNNDGR